MTVSEALSQDKAKVIILSAFGRGHWLATELILLGLEVTLVDVTDSMGLWAPEDWEGPHGYFKTDKLLESQKVSLSEEDTEEEIPQGFSVWLKTGPFDMRSSQSEHALRQREVDPVVQDYLLRYLDLKPRERLEAVKKIAEIPFAKSWLAHMAHALGSTQDAESTEAIHFGQPLPIFSPYFIRRASRRGLSQSLERLQDLGIRVLRKVKLKDLSHMNQSLLNIEISSEEWSGVIAADQFVWMLSSQETSALSNRALEVLYSGKTSSPVWCWSRYTFELDHDYAYQTMPTQFLFVSDLALWWSGSNVQLVQKSQTKNRFDVWLKVPSAHRFQKNYMEELAQQVKSVWESRVPNANFKLIDYPQEYRYSESELGPSRHPVFDSQDLKKIKRKSFKNIHYDGPELWESYDRTERFSASGNILTRLRAWKLEYDKEQEKLRAKRLSEMQQ